MKKIKFLTLTLAIALVAFSSFSVRQVSKKQLDPRVLEYVEEIVVGDETRLVVDRDLTSLSWSEGNQYNCDALPVNDFCTVEVDDVSNIMQATGYKYITPAHKIDDSDGKFDIN